MARTLKVLLTGGNGYLGEHIRKVLKKKEVDLFLLGRKDIERLLKEESYKINQIPKIFSCEILNKEYDLLIHTAAISALDSFKYKDQIDIINVDLTNYLAKYCKIKNTFFLFLSSVQVYGSELNGIYSESSELRPYSLYSYSKANAEKKVLDKLDKNLLKGTILRIGNIVGSPLSINSQGWNLYANSSILESITKSKITIKNNSNIRRNFVSITLFIDFLNHLIFLLKNKSYDLPNIINITSNDSLSLYDFALKLKKFNKNILDNSITIEFQSKSINMVPFSNISNERLKGILSNSVNYEIDKIIQQTIKYNYKN